MANPLTQAEKVKIDWYVSPGGQIWQATGAEADFLRYGLGWQGPLSYASAQAAADATPTRLKDLNQTTTNAVRNTANAATSTVTGVADIGDFFHRLTESATWTRVGEVLFGGLLLYVGLRALTHGSSTVGGGARKAATKPVRKVATKAAKVVVPEARLASRVAAKRVAPKTTAKVQAHRSRVRRYGGKTPYQPSKPKTVIHKSVRVSHVHHHKAGP